MVRTAHNLRLAEAIKQMARERCTPAQLALARLLAATEHSFPFGTRHCARVDENLGALSLTPKPARLAAVRQFFSSRRGAAGRMTLSILIRSLKGSCLRDPPLKQVMVRIIGSWRRKIVRIQLRSARSHRPGCPSFPTVRPLPAF